MKTVFIHLEDAEHKLLKEKKGKLSWRDYLTKDKLEEKT
jgi:hypothetical protein